MNQSHWPYFKPFYLYLPLAAALLVWAERQAAFSRTSGAWLFILGGLSWTFLEYAIHRGLFHPLSRSPRWLRITSQSHLAHHEDPQDIRLVFAQFSTSLPAGGLLFLLLWALLPGWSEAAMILAGSWAGYLLYELVHYWVHFRASTTPLMRYLKSYHLLHHHQDAGTRFGVTTPLVDWLFGTYRPISGKPRPGAQTS